MFSLAHIYDCMNVRKTPLKNRFVKPLLIQCLQYAKKMRKKQMFFPQGSSVSFTYKSSDYSLSINCGLPAIVISFTYLYPIPFYGDQRDGKLLILGHKSFLAKIKMNILCSKQGFALHPKENNQRTK